MSAAAASSELNIVQLYKDIVERQKRRTHAFEKVLAPCHQLIKKASKQDKMACLYAVPDFVLGVPPYDVGECVKHVMARLEKGGFYVKYYFPNLLYISWDLKDLERKETPEGSKLTPLKLMDVPQASDNMALIDPKKRMDLSKSILPRRTGKFSLSLE